MPIQRHTPDPENARRCAGPSARMRRRALLRGQVPQQSAAPPDSGQRVDRLRLSELPADLHAPRPRSSICPPISWPRIPTFTSSSASRRQAVEPGWHFGSRYPGDPAKVMVYDFIPDLLLDKIVNRARISGRAGLRQMDRQRRCPAIHFLPRTLAAMVAFGRRSAERLGFVAHMMDHGYVFDGPHWTFPIRRFRGSTFGRASTSRSHLSTIFSPGSTA